MSDLPPLHDVETAWPVESSRDLHRDDWVMALRQDRVRQPGHDDEEAFGRLVLEHPGAVIVLAVDDEDRVLVLWQYRHPAGRVFVELPAGLIDGDTGHAEEPVEVARRELREEAGLEAGSWTHLTTTWSSPGISTERIHHFLAREVRDVGRGDFEPRHEEAEMTAGWVPAADLREAVLAGRVGDGPLVVSLLTAHVRGLLGDVGAGR